MWYCTFWCMPTKWLVVSWAKPNMIIIINSNSTKNDRKTTDARQRRGVGPSRYRLDLFEGKAQFDSFKSTTDGLEKLLTFILYLDPIYNIFGRWSFTRRAIPSKVLSWRKEVVGISINTRTLLALPFGTPRATNHRIGFRGERLLASDTLGCLLGLIFIWQCEIITYRWGGGSSCRGC